MYRYAIIRDNTVLQYVDTTIKDDMAIFFSMKNTHGEIDEIIYLGKISLGEE